MCLRRSCRRSARALAGLHHVTCGRRGGEGVSPRDQRWRHARHPDPPEDDSAPLHRVVTELLLLPPGPGRTVLPHYVALLFVLKSFVFAVSTAGSCRIPSCAREVEVKMLRFGPRGDAGGTHRSALLRPGHELAACCRLSLFLSELHLDASHGAAVLEPLQ